MTRYKKHYKPKKKYTKTQKVLYHTGKFLGEAKEGIKAGWKGAVKAAPAVSRYARTTRAEVAREFGEEEIQQRQEQRVPTREEIRELERLNKRLRIKRKSYKEPFIRVVRESKSNSNDMKLGWGGF